MPRGIYDRSAARAKREASMTSIDDEPMTVAAARATEPDVEADEAPRAAARQRLFKMGDAEIQDKFRIDPRLIPEGQSWEWKRYTTYGAGDPSYDVYLRSQGWLPVDPKKYPQLVPPGHTGPILRDGMMLMERPIELTQEAKAEEAYKAKAQMRAKQQELGMTPPGHLPREGGSAGAKISRSMDAFQIPVE